MAYQLLADAVVLLHVLFVMFVVLGGLAARRRVWVAWAHLPAAAWGVAIEYGGWTCPLTPLENALRTRAGEAGYPGGFVVHYVVPALYPAGLTPPGQWVLGTSALLVNVIVYGIIVWRARRSTSAGASPSEERM